VPATIDGLYEVVMKVRDASGAALLAAAWFVACNGRVSLGSPDTANANGGSNPANGTGAAIGAHAGDGGVGAVRVPVTSGAPGDDASSSSSSGDDASAAPATSAAADAGADGGCGSMQFDPHNCGACGNDCMGGACQAGVCVPLPAGVLATGQLSPTSIAVDANNVYWVNEGLLTGPPSNLSTSLGPVQILKCAKSGCNNNPTVLVTDWSDQGDGGRLRGLAVDATNVYWASANTLYSCAVGGCNNSPTVLNRFTVSPSAGWPGIAPEIAAAAGNVYASDSSTANRFAVASGGSIPLWSLGSSGLWMAIAVDDASAYIGTTFGEIVSCAIGGCGGAPTSLVPQPSQPSPVHLLGQLAVDNTNVYWTQGQIGMPYMPVSNGFVTGCAGTGQVPPGSILKCTKAGCGGNPTTLASGLSCPTGVVTDGSNVYFTEPQYYGGGPTPGLSDADVGRIGKCNVAGCSNQPTTLADKLNNPRGIAIDADHAYWTDFGSGGTAPPLLGGPLSPPYSDDGRIVIIAK
jgi:hypothetical protein